MFLRSLTINGLFSKSPKHKWIFVVLIFVSAMLSLSAGAIVGLAASAGVGLAASAGVGLAASAGVAKNKPTVKKAKREPQQAQETCQVLGMARPLAAAPAASLNNIENLRAQVRFWSCRFRQVQPTQMREAELKDDPKWDEKRKILGAATEYFKAVKIMQTSLNNVDLRPDRFNLYLGEVRVVLDYANETMFENPKDLKRGCDDFDQKMRNGFHDLPRGASESELMVINLGCPF